MAGRTPKQSATSSPLAVGALVRCLAQWKAGNRRVVTTSARQSLIEQATMAVAGGMRGDELESTIRYLAWRAGVELEAADVDAIASRAVSSKLAAAA
jgi:hypothetical protein